MESRLPKPKILSTTSISTTSSTNGVPERLKKAKTTLNDDAKLRKENKPPSKPNLIRSKTMSSITTKATKRPATNADVQGEAKKPCTKPMVKPTVQKTAMLRNNTTESARNVAVKKTVNTAATRPAPKWDLKGRLAKTTDELSNIRQKYKESTSKFTELQNQITTLEADLKDYRSKAEEYENLNKVLDNKNKQLGAELSIVQEEREHLSKRLMESEELCKNVSASLKKTQEKCVSLETLLSNSTLEIDNLRTTLDTKTKACEELSTEKSELQMLVHTMDKDRRILHNAIQELKGNIRVFCRVRPATPNELGKPTCNVNFIDESTIEISKSDGSDTVGYSGKSRGTRQEFSFDKVFPPTANQEHVFEELSLLVQSALEGYNVCVFAYGQTGSGKTYTMEGLPGTETEGMIPRTVRHIFEEMKQFELLGWEYRIEASFLEIYNEHIVDLLDSQPKTHEIRMADNKGRDLYVSNLKVEEIHSPDELHDCLLRAQCNRAVAATLSNERSSRSHSVTRIKLTGVHQSKKEISVGTLNLVDLAGSERLKGDESARMTETKNINKSLANLGNVILALLKKHEHVPYRNSKLTHLLMPSLGGNSKTLMLLNISPLDECFKETLNSLRFGSNVNSCRIGNVKRSRTVLQNS